MKKNNIVILVILCALIAVCIGYSRGWAQASRQISPAKVGVVNVDLVLKDSRKHAKWQERMNAEERRFKAEVAKLEAEVEVILLDMQPRPAGSPDHIRLMEQGMAKTAALDLKRKVYDRQMMFKVKNWTEQLYDEIRSIVEKTAKARGLDIVLSADEIEFPAADVRDLLTIIKTNKVLYHSSRIDITEDVLAQLDSAL